MKILFMLSAMLLGFSEAGEGPNGVTTGSSDLYKLSEDQVCSLLVHSNLSHLQSIVKREGLNGIVLSTAVDSEKDLVKVGMKPLLARTLFRKIAKWKRTGLPDDFDVNDIATSSSADNNGLKKEEDVEYTQLRNEQLRSDYRKALCTDLAAIARIQNAADAENHIAEGYLSVLYGDLHCDGFIPAEQQFDRVRYAIRAIPWIIEEADEGCPDANYLLGRFLFDGIGITKDVDEAVYRLSLSAEADHVNAITTLGLGIPLSSAKRLEFLNAAVERGCPVAQYLLGCCNEVGGIVALNLKEAVRFYKLSAEQGYLMAEIALNRLATD